MDTTRLYELIARVQQNQELSDTELQELNSLYTTAKIQGVPGLPELPARQTPPPPMEAVQEQPQANTNDTQESVTLSSQGTEQPQEVVTDQPVVEYNPPSETNAQPEGADFPQPMEAPTEPVTDAQPSMDSIERILRDDRVTISALIKQLRLFQDVHKDVAEDTVLMSIVKLQEAKMWLGEALIDAGFGVPKEHRDDTE